MDKDLIIIGGGPGGYVAAIRAAQLGAGVCLIERHRLGGTCLNHGCIPTKALYRNAEVLNTIRNAEQFGLKIDGYSLDVGAVQQRKQSVVNQLVGGVEQLLKANGVEVLFGSGSFKDKNTIEVDLADGTSRELTAANIIIAAGSKPAVLPVPGAGLSGVYTSEQILDFEDIPQSLAVIGGGVIGMELAGIFNVLGSKVTVIEFLPNILSQVDTDLTKRLAAALKRKGIDIYTSAKVTGIEKEKGELTVHAEGKSGEITVQADAVLMAVGRLPCVEGLNLESVGVEFDRKGIRTDEHFETGIKGIYAIGDANGKVMLAHAASHQGMAAAENIMGVGSGISPGTVPNCIFIFPEIACAGITEDLAKEKGMDYKTSKFLFGANGKALALGEPEGMVKVIADRENTIIGVHIMGPHASDLIHEGVLAIDRKFKVEDIKHVIHAHPTLSEAFYEAVLGLKGEAVHMINKR